MTSARTLGLLLCVLAGCREPEDDAPPPVAPLPPPAATAPVLEACAHSDHERVAVILEVTPTEYRLADMSGMDFHVTPDEAAIRAALARAAQVRTA